MVVHLTDSHVLTQPSLYLSACLLALRAMLQLDLPHVNVLSKIDNIAHFPPLAMDLEFYTEAHGLEYLLPALDREMGARFGGGAGPGSTDEDGARDQSVPAAPNKFSALNRALVDLVEDFSLLAFATLAIEHKASVAALVRAVDRAGGHAFAPRPADGSAPDAGGAASAAVWEVAMRAEGVEMTAADVWERWGDPEGRERAEREERKAWEEEGRRAEAEAEVGAGDGAGDAATKDAERRGGVPGGKDDGDEDEDEAALRRWEAERGKDGYGGGVTVVRKGGT